MHPVRRRKKRPNYGVRTVEVSRGKNGFGFTISGQQPCILSCIVSGSPAEKAGLRPGDYLVAVNGQSVSKLPHDDVVRLIGCLNGVLKLQIAENYYSDSSDEDHVVTTRTKPRFIHKPRSANANRSNLQPGRTARTAKELRSNVSHDKFAPERASLPSRQALNESWELPALPPPRVSNAHHSADSKEELCFVIGYLGTIEMPKQIQPGCRPQVVRGCIKRLRAEKRSHSWVLMRVHADGVTVAGSGGKVLAEYPVNRIIFCGPSSEEDKKYFGLVTIAAGDGNEVSPSSSCHVFAVQSNLFEHQKHFAKASSFKITCTSGTLSQGCFEFPPTSEPILNAIKSFCLTKDEGSRQLFNNEMLLANSPQPSHSGSTAASSNSDSGIGFRDDCGNQSDRIVMVDVENQRLHIQQLYNNSKGIGNAPNSLNIQLQPSDGSLETPSANLQNAFACVSALCPLPVTLNPLCGSCSSDHRLTVRAIPDSKVPTSNRSRSPLNSSSSSSDDDKTLTKHARLKNISSRTKGDRSGLNSSKLFASEDSSKSLPVPGLWYEKSIFYQLGLAHPDKSGRQKGMQNLCYKATSKSSDNLDQSNYYVQKEDSDSSNMMNSKINSKSTDNLMQINTSDVQKSYKLSPQVNISKGNFPSHKFTSPLSISYGEGSVLLKSSVNEDLISCDKNSELLLSYSMSPNLNFGNGVCKEFKHNQFKSADDMSICSSRSNDILLSYKLSPKVFGVKRPLITHSLEDLKGSESLRDTECATLDNSRIQQWGSLQDLRSMAPGSFEQTLAKDTVTRNEVSILLNGRSADTVLQGQKEHVIPSVNIKEPVFPQGSISGILTKESLQYFLREEDVGGEDGGKIQIDLERKMENTLLYIQPNMNLTASIRIIPVDTDMVHLWRRTRDTGSLISSEVDLRLHSPQDSIENNALRNPIVQSSFSRRIMPENHQQTVDEIDEVLSTETLPGSTLESSRSIRAPPKTYVTDYNSLLLETRTIVDSLTKNFKIMQTRLDGETNRSLQLQGEVNKLRLLLKNNGEKSGQKKNTSRENINEHHLMQFDGTSSVSLFAVKEIQEKKEAKTESINEEAFEDCQEVPNETFENKALSTIHISYPMEKDPEKVFLNTNGFVTVNIYTMETQSSRECIVGSQETNSLLQENLGIIERKMKRLQDENDTIGRQNMELKKKLKEISQELEKYLGGTSEPELCAEDDEELDTLRDQVCNLKLELDNLKTTAWHKEEELSTEKSALLQKLSKHLTVQEEWCATATEIFLQLQKEKNRLAEIGLELDLNTDLKVTKDPKCFQTDIMYYLQQVTELLFTLRNENYIYDETLKQSTQKLHENSTKDFSGLDRVISGYTELIEQCRKSAGNSDTKVMEDYFTVIMEKASLTEEIKILKTENEMLLESQLEHYEKLKQTMIALKDRKNEIEALESSQKISEEERNRMKDMVKVHEEEKQKLEAEISQKKEEIEKLKTEKDIMEVEMSEDKEKLKMALNELKNVEISFKLKEDFIKDLQLENEKLVSADRIKTNKLEMLENEMKQKTELESELLSTKLYLTESQKEMSDYVTNLETVINNTQDALDKTKQKLKESNQTISRLKTENEILDKQHGCDLKLFNTTKDELDVCKESLTTLTERVKELEEEKEKLHKNFEALSKAEKEKTEALEVAEKQYKIIWNENLCLKDKMEIFSRDKDESIKEQKDLINKYGMLSKEVQKLQEKYRNVKIECNERTDLIKYLEAMLKENMLEYNSRIACLEKNISRILEKIAACKSSMKEKHFGSDSEIKELRHQLDVTCQERRELENVVDNYYTLIKHLENELEDREKKVVELHEKVSLGQQKAMDYENAKMSMHSMKEVSLNKDYLKVEELEIQLATTEKELLECKKNLQDCQINYEGEKKKLELIIADLNSEIKRYQLRIEVMMRNLSTSKLSIANSLFEKRLYEDKSVSSLKKEIDEKDQKIQQLNDSVNNYKNQLELKDCELTKFKKKSQELDEELKSLQNQYAKVQDNLLATSKNNEIQQKDREEMGEKLLQSIKLVMEERSARQTLEMLAAEKEKNFNEQIEGLKTTLSNKEKEYETLMNSFEEKKKLTNKLQDIVRRLKIEVASLKTQIGVKTLNNPNSEHSFKKSPPFKSTSLNNIDQQQINFKDRLEACMTELKEVRELNLQLRKTEGQYQAKIIRLEDEIRDARLLIKELQGDIKTEKKSKNALKNMISSAKLELEKCLLAKQLVSAVADRISRHLDLREIPSRELLSGFRISDNSNSSPLQIFS